MPGTIHVSASSPSSSILIKASVGKRTFESWGNGEFSLPLTTLRDNVSITVLDTDGNEMSKAGVQTISIVERGSLEQSLSLEGGGAVHLQFRFLLSVEERAKLRKMRESAVKRKRDELLASSPQHSKTATMAGGKVTASPCANHENEEEGSEENLSRLAEKSEKMVHQIDGTETVTSEDASSNSEKNVATSEVTNHHLPRQMTPSDARSMDEMGRSEDTWPPDCISRARDAPSDDKNPNTSENKVETGAENDGSKLAEVKEMKLEPFNFLERPEISKDVSADSGKDLAPFEVKKHAVVQTGRRESLQESGSSVLKMISAFETSLLKETRPGIKPPPTKLQPDKVGLEASDGKLKPTQTDGTRNEEHVGTDLSKEPPSVVQAQGKETESVAKDKGRKPEEERVKMLAVQGLNKNRPLNLSDREDGDSTRIGRPRSVVHLSDSHETSVQRPSENEAKMMDPCRYERSPLEGSGGWIFLDEGTHGCMMTDSKQVTYLAGGCRIGERVDRVIQRFSLPENVHIGKSEFRTELNQRGIIAGELGKSRVESSPGAETTPGPFGQVVKIAIMVAFGTLVLLTRQQKPRSVIYNHTKAR